MKLIEENQQKQEIPAMGSWPKSIHEFDSKSIWAVNAALTAQRPLLIRGEPGVGKSQLARAAAQVLGRVFISEVVHAHSECLNLLWNFDAVARLGEAQSLVGCREDIKNKMDPLRFLSPGPLWWAFDWQSAQQQAEMCMYCGRKPEKPEKWEEQMGSVLLIDEIDKADVDLPNGLLETLGNGAFTVPYIDKPIKLKENIPFPLVVITTNEERELPSAFLRRCMVLHMKLPKEKAELIEWLITRGEIHFEKQCSEKVRRKTAEQLWEDRVIALKHNLCAPGQAEYIDILTALCKISTEEDQQLKALDKIKDFALKKYVEENE